MKIKNAIKNRIESIKQRRENKKDGEKKPSIEERFEAKQKEIPNNKRELFLSELNISEEKLTEIKEQANIGLAKMVKQPSKEPKPSKDDESR